MKKMFFIWIISLILSLILLIWTFQHEPIGSDVKEDDSLCHGEFLSFDGYATPAGENLYSIALNWVIWCDYGGIYGYGVQERKISLPSYRFKKIPDVFITPNPGNCSPCTYSTFFVIKLEDGTYNFRVDEIWLDGTHTYSPVIRMTFPKPAAQ